MYSVFAQCRGLWIKVAGESCPKRDLILRPPDPEACTKTTPRPVSCHRLKNLVSLMWKTLELIKSKWCNYDSKSTVITQQSKALKETCNECFMQSCLNLIMWNWLKISARLFKQKRPTLFQQISKRWNQSGKISSSYQKDFCFSLQFFGANEASNLLLFKYMVLSSPVIIEF